LFDALKKLFIVYSDKRFLEGGIHISLLKEKVKNLPLTPGVYLMKDLNGSIIYVGKAKNLKRRVQTYFQNSGSHLQKIIKLKNNIQDFDVILTDTEFEAFMLECQLIKEIKPFFNKKMKNPQSYCFIAIQMNEKLPEIEVTNNQIPNKNSLLFGPYINKHTAEKAVLGLKEFYKIFCSNPTSRRSPCLNYSMGLCIGMCFDDSAVEQYRNIIHKISCLLNGTDLSILDEMNGAMITASENLDFVKAAKYRDIIEAINSLIFKENVIGFTEADNNIAIFEYLSDSSFKFFLIKGNQLLYRQKYVLDPNNPQDLGKLIKMKLITIFTASDSPLSSGVGKDEIDEAQIIYSYLNSGSCNYKIIPNEWLSIDHPDLNAAINSLLKK
jgi:excinuclease ABC subunit C